MHFLKVGILLFLFFLLGSCTRSDVDDIRAELRNYEYTRQVQPEKFAQWLNSPDVAVRQLAVQTLGRIQDTSAVVLIGNRLKDKNPAVRATAAFALGQLFNPVAEPYLIEASRTENDTIVLSNILEALGKSGTENSFPVLKRFLEQKNELLLQRAAMASGILSFRGYIPFRNAFDLEQLLTQHSSPEVRWRAAYALFRMRSPTSYLIFTKALGDKNDYVRYMSLKGLTELFKIASSPDLSDFEKNPKFKRMKAFFNSRKIQNRIILLLEDPIWYVRIAALQFIQTTKWPGFKKAVIKAIDSQQPHVQIEAIKTLRVYPDNSTKKYLWQLYSKSTDWRKRGTILETLSSIDPRKTLSVISREFENYDWPGTVYLIRALEAISDPKSIDMLKKIADSPIIAQQTLAIEALSNKKVEDDYLIQKLTTQDPAIVTIVALYFSKTKNPKAVAPLIQAYQKFTPPQDLEPMEAVLVALDSINTPESVEFLKSQANNPYPPVRKILASAFERRNIDWNKITNVSGKMAYATRWDFKIPNEKIIQVEFETTQGNFTLELYPVQAPVTVASFLSLIKKKYYNGLFFHRVVPGFVIQGGDPRGDGWGGPGYAIPCEYNLIHYTRGVVGMAHAGKDTGGSQFFITHLPQPHLDGKYTAFGRVISGMDVVDKIQIYDKIIAVKVLP